MAEFNLLCKNGVKVILINGKDAVEQFSKIDLFISSMSDFDLHSRLRIGSDQSVSMEKYVNFITRQIVDWNAESIKAIESTIKVLNTRKNFRYFQFPEIIYVIMTNGMDEGAAAYCRNMNLIIMPQDDLFDMGCISTDKNSGLEYNTTFTHEMFHIWSRNNISLRDRLYKIINYYPTPNVIDLPKDLSNLKITNPDAPITHHYIELNTSISDEPLCLAPVLIAKSEYDPSEPNFFSYLQKKFVVLDKNTLESTDKMLDYDQVTDLFDKIGRNTKYIIHPEEILADNFVCFVHETSDLPNPEIMDKILEVVG